MSQEDIDQTIKAEQLYFQPRAKTYCYLAVNGAKTKNDGLVSASAKELTIGGLAIACVADDVIYTDGITAINILKVIKLRKIIIISEQDAKNV